MVSKPGITMLQFNIYIEQLPKESWNENSLVIYLPTCILAESQLVSPEEGNEVYTIEVICNALFLWKHFYNKKLTDRINICRTQAMLQVIK